MKNKISIKRGLAGFLALLILITAVFSGNVLSAFAEETEGTVYTWRETTAERNLYYDDFTTANIGKVYSGETIEEILQMIEDPSVDIDLETFFDGTCFAGCDEEALAWFQEQGYTLEQLIKEVSDAGMSSVWNYLYGVMPLSDYAALTVSFFNSSVTVTIPELNRTSHAFYYMKMSGHVAFCLDSGKHMYSGTVLDYDSESSMTLYRQAIAYYEANSGTNSLAYEYAQMYIWTGGDQSSFITAMSQLVYSLQTGELDSDAVIAGGAARLSTGYYYTALNTYNILSGMSTSNIEAYVYTTGNSAFQRLVTGYRTETPPETPDPPVYELGKLNIVKVDADNGSTTAQGNASLNGAVYGLYARNDIIDPTDGVTVVFPAGTQVSTVTISSGSAFIEGLYSGNYYLQETSAPTGYQLSGTTYDVTLNTSETATVSVTVKDNVIRGGVTIQKVDSDWKTNNPQGDATLQGAKYAIVNDSTNAVYVNGASYANGSTVMTLTTDSSGNASSGTVLPYGNYSLYEVSASTGYLVNNTKQSFSITSNGQVVSFTSGEMTEEVMRGGVTIQKVDNDWGTNDPQGDATLQGAVYAIVNNSSHAVYVNGKTYANGETVMTLTTDSEGKMSSGIALPYGSYYYYETKASTGYLVDDTKHYFTIRSDGEIVSFTSGETTEEVIRGGLTLQKFDVESLLAKEQGGADFKGLVMEITNKSANAVYVNGKTYAVGEVVATVATNENGCLTLSGDALPYGTYGLTEVGYLDADGKVVYVEEGDALGTSGYLRLGTLTRTFTIRTDGQIVDLSSSASVGISNTVIRGDIVLRKIDADTQKAMAGVQFKITLYDKNGNAVESHIITTDENGQYDSSSTYASHTAENGLWFGDAAPDDSRGALPYGTYTIEEIEGEANAGRTMYSDTFVISNKTNAAGMGYKVDLGNLENVMINISTMAECEDTGSQYAFARECTALVDTVFYDHLVVGREYTLKAYVADAETGELLTDENGDPVTGTAVWTANLTSGYRKVDIVCDTTELAGKTLVIYEYLYFGDLLLVSHEDPEDTDQMIYVCGIRTTALDQENGTHMSYADGEVTIVDTVEYLNLQPMRSYNMVGMLMDKETGKQAVDEEGNPITATTSFRPSEKDGTVDVVFTFDAADMEGKILVAFETLERADSYHTVWAVHEELSEFSQSIFFPQIKTSASVSQMEIIEGHILITVTDTVTYKNLVPGYTYTVSGALMDKETGEKLLDAEGNEVTAEAEFTPEMSDGTIDVAFVFDGTGMSKIEAVAFEELAVDGCIIAEHKDPDDEEQTVEVELPKIKTSASVSQMEIIEGRILITVTDTVTYTDLVPGYTYTVSGALMDKETGEKLLDAEGNEVTAEAEFTPETADGTVDVAFVFDGTGMSKIEAVAFEELAVDGYIIADHKDLEDEEQTVEVELPKIGTKAAAGAVKRKDGTIEFTVTDTVAYENLITGYTYTVSGILMDKETGEELLTAEGNPVTAETEFTPETSDGSVEVAFIFDGTGLIGKEAVVFEELAVEGYVIADHKDLEDEDQTVTLNFEEKPSEDKPTENKPAEETPAEETVITTETPKTGDIRSGGLILLFAAGTVLLIAAAARKSRKEKKHDGTD